MLYPYNIKGTKDYYMIYDNDDDTFEAIECKKFIDFAGHSKNGEVANFSIMNEEIVCSISNTWWRSYYFGAYTLFRYIDKWFVSVNYIERPIFLDTSGKLQFKFCDVTGLQNNVSTREVNIHEPLDYDWLNLRLLDSMLENELFLKKMLEYNAFDEDKIVRMSPSIRKRLLLG